MAPVAELEHLEYCQSQTHALETQPELLTPKRRFRRRIKAWLRPRHQNADLRALMAVLGLVPSEHSSGSKEHRERHLLRPKASPRSRLIDLLRHGGNDRRLDTISTTSAFG